jgi:xanthine dehydrogenase YagS FAD-binding subunit
MFPFAYVRATDEAGALAASGEGDAHYLAGGTTLIDLMRLDVMRPNRLVDITAIPLGKVEAIDGGIRVGALVRNSDLAYHPLVAQLPVLREALLAGASPQIRNMATLGGNAMQRTRCAYFRDPGVAACNKRSPGSGCAAIGGYTRMHAVLGGSPSCIAVNPSDMCVALAALDAVVRTRRQGGSTRTLPFVDLHLLPGDHPERETALEPGELITHIDVPTGALAARSHYLKVRDRASYAFALASAGVALDHDGKTIRDARVALGGVGTKPWRSREAERELVGAPLDVDTFRRAAEVAMREATPQKDNAFKIELARRTLVRALVELTEAS